MDKHTTKVGKHIMYFTVLGDLVVWEITVIPLVGPEPTPKKNTGQQQAYRENEHSSHFQ
jgi:hypothetical protein